MRKQHWPKRDPIKNYFPLPNEIFSLGLSAGAIAVYGFLLHREDRRTYQLSLIHISCAVGNNLRKTKTVCFKICKPVPNALCYPAIRHLGRDRIYNILSKI